MPDISHRLAACVRQPAEPRMKGAVAGRLRRLDRRQGGKAGHAPGRRELRSNSDSPPIRRLRHDRGRIVQPGVEVLRKCLADAAHEVPHQTGATDLGQRAGERVADDDIDAGRFSAGVIGERGQPCSRRYPRRASRCAGPRRGPR